MRRRSQRLSILIPVLLLPLAGCREQPKYVKPLTTVRVQPVEIYRGAQGQTYSGNIEPLTRVDVVARLGGYVEEIQSVEADGKVRPLQEGDAVTKGSVLVTLRQSDFAVKVDEARSQQEEARYAIAQSEEAVKGSRALRDKAQLDWDRARNLFEKKSLAKPDFDGARAQLDGAQAQLDANQAQVKLAQARLEGAGAMLREAELAQQDSKLKAPLNATILKRLVEVGTLVGPGTPVLVLGDISSVKTVFGLADTMLPKIRTGMTLPVKSEAVPGATYEGRVTRIAPTADPRTRVFDVELTVPNRDGRLKPGMIASLTLPGEESQAVPVIPLAAVVQPPGGSQGYMVYLAEAQGGKAVAKAQMVQLGDALGDRIAVREGLRAGQNVVVTGASLVHDGEQVEVLP